MLIEHVNRKFYTDSTCTCLDFLYPKLCFTTSCKKPANKHLSLNSMIYKSLKGHRVFIIKKFAKFKKWKLREYIRFVVIHLRV